MHERDPQITSSPSQKRQVSLSDLPDGRQTEVNFEGSAYFKTHASLPTPDEVRELCPTRSNFDPLPVKFESLGLVVKFGPFISTSEGRCLWIIRKLLGDEVPVPELYGWRIDGRDTFIYMELVQGPTLEARWDTMDIADKESVTDHLQQILSSLRTIRQDPSDPFIGSLNRGIIPDRVLEGKRVGPFASVRDLHNWLSMEWRRHAPEPEKVEDPWRDLLSDAAPILLTHADIHRSNIIVSTSSPVRVAAIVDWTQSGWYPDYWEYCKARYTVGDWEDWYTEGWVDKILNSELDSNDAFYFYVRAMGSL